MNGLFEKLSSKRSGCWINQDYLGILGYADDNFLIAPTMESLQEMLYTCEEYALEHNLKFSTNPILAKCKTKCLAFLFKARNLRKLTLCGNNLPWDDHGKHLGNTIENTINGLVKDILIKRARYIQRNNELIQEFHFAHPKTLFDINLIYNGHFTGSPLWDIFSKEAEMFEKTWNTSVRTMYDLPRSAHKYFVEEISGTPHLKSILIKRFLNFTEQIKMSKKIALKNVFQKMRKNCQSVTGSNLRKIMLLVGKQNVDDLDILDADKVKYNMVIDSDQWRINLVNEITEIKFGDLHVEGFTWIELNDMLQEVCTT